MSTRIQINNDAGLLWSFLVEMEQTPAPVNPPPAIPYPQWEWPTLPVPVASPKEVEPHAPAIQSASELKLLEASNLYKLATRARDIPTKIENISLALQCIEEGLAIAESQSQIKYALIAKKAHIQMDILEEQGLEYPHVDYPLLSREFPLIRMSIDEIDQMVTTAHDEYKKLLLQSPKLAKEFANLSLRVDAACIPALVSDRIEGEPIELELEGEAMDALLIDAPEVLPADDRSEAKQRTDATPQLSIRAVEVRKILNRKSGKLCEAKKYYAAAMNADQISLIARKLVLALRNIEDGLKIGSSTSKTQYSLIEMKAEIYLKIFENATLHQFLIHQPDIIFRYRFTEMTLNELEGMVKDVHDDLEKTSQSFKKSKSKQNKFADFKDLLKRIGDIRKQTEEKETVIGPIALNLEDQPQEVVLAEDRVMPVQRAPAIAKNILKRVNDLYWAMSTWTDELEKKSQLQGILDTIEEGLKDPNILIKEKAALILRKSQIQFELGKNRLMIKRQVKVMQKEIDDAEFSRTPWSTIYSLNHLLGKIKEERVSNKSSGGRLKRKSEDELLSDRKPKKIKS